MSTVEQIIVMNQEDQTVSKVVLLELKSINKAINRIIKCLKNNGRLFYVGAGTSGRLAALDAYECPPTFGTNKELVQAIVAGGESALYEATEEAEDNYENGKVCLQQRQFDKSDVVLGIAASGSTPYVLGALEYAKGIGALTISLSCNMNSLIGEIAEIPIEINVGPEVIMGSTRLKAGTAQKMVLNMISTITMINMGKTYKNYMVDLQMSNKKLQKRAIHIVQQATGVSWIKAEQTNQKSGNNIKASIIMLIDNVDSTTAHSRLKKANGIVRKALQHKG